jgi:ABC-type bacteriocin/lantibiotic exporter with double-glycine peptidase domain
MLLALYDVPVDHKRLDAVVPVNREGTSLAQMQEAAGTLGLEVALRRCKIGELQKRFHTPCIAHLAMVGDPHYVVVISITDDYVTFLDGTTGKLEKLHREWVEERWSGYVLLPQTGGTNVMPVLVKGSLSFWLVITFLVAKRVWGSRERAHKGIPPVATPVSAR